MFNFNLKNTAIFQAVKWEKHPAFRFAKFLKKLFFVLSVVVFAFFLYGFISERFTQEVSSKLLGTSLIFLVFALMSWVQEKFFESLKNPKLKITLAEVIENLGKYNLAEFLSFESAKAVWRSIQFTDSKNLAQINSSVLLYFLIVDNPKLNFIFFRAALNLKEFKKLLKAHFQFLKSEEVESSPEKYSKDFQDTIIEVLNIGQKKGHQRIEIWDLISGLAQYDLVFKKVLADSELKCQDIKSLADWQEFIDKEDSQSKRFWEYENLTKAGTLAKEWTSGYTITLDRYSIDWTDIIRKQGFRRIIGHKEELKQVQRILSSKEFNNVLMVGKPGTGRKSMIQLLAHKSLSGQGLRGLNYKRIVELDMPSLLSELESKEEVEKTLDKIFQEAVSAGNTILVIDNFHNFIGNIEGVGIIDISGIISSYLNLPQFQVVGITTYVGLHKYIEQKPAILSLFGKVEISEISDEETLILLENSVPLLEKDHKVFIAYPALREIVSLTRRYLPNKPFPKKAIDILNEAVIYVATATKDNLVMPKHIRRMISEKTQVPVGEAETKEKKLLLNLESLIHQRIINQEEAVNEISTALRRARAEITIRKGPMGVFLFLGPTGVGKTETSKALSEIYFGAEEKMIRLDMSEFQDIKDIPRLIGSPGQEGLLTTRIKEEPFSLILLDELEKAHPSILNLFLQVFDEGHLTDGSGRKVDFKDSIIIATSNAGYKVILEALSQREESLLQEEQKSAWTEIKSKLLDFLFEKAIFRPEFINRFDAVVVFHPLSKKNLLDITELMLQKLKNNLKKKGIELIITEALKEKIVELGYSPTFGAREMRRVIQTQVENVLAEALLSEELKRGDKIEIEPEEFKLLIR